MTETLSTPFVAGKTALEWAIRKGKTDVADLLKARLVFFSHLRLASALATSSMIRLKVARDVFGFVVLIPPESST